MPFSYFGAMFYKLVKWLLVAAVLFCLVLVLGLSMGWMGLQKIPLVFKSWILFTGLFIFYLTRKKTDRATWLIWPSLLVHLLVLPVAIVMVLAIGNETLAYNYWFLLNLVMVVFLGIAWILLVSGLTMPALPKVSLMLASLAYVVILCLHMAGKFNNGKIVLFFGVFLFLATVLLIFFAIKKPVPATPDVPAGE